MRRTWLIAAALLALALQGCGYNELQRGDEQIKAAWSEVLNQYQRRADLVPNLVATVKGFAEQEKEVLTRVTDARARAGQIQATPHADAVIAGIEALTPLVARHFPTSPGGRNELPDRPAEV